MPAFASIESTSVPLARPAAAVGVFRIHPGGGGSDYLRNVQVLSIRYREGADAGVARFRYVFNFGRPGDVPDSFQEALSVDSGVPGVVANDDRLRRPDLQPRRVSQVLFDGFAQVPELGLDPDRERSPSSPSGSPIREWDTPIGGALMRDADDPAVVSDDETDLVTQFNPAGLPNATPTEADAVDPSGKPTRRSSTPWSSARTSPALWTLPMAVRYLCYRQNPDQTYVAEPRRLAARPILDSRSPTTRDGGSSRRPGQLRERPLIVPDYPATGKAWPAASPTCSSPTASGWRSGSTPTSRALRRRRSTSSASRTARSTT